MIDRSSGSASRPPETPATAAEAGAQLSDWRAGLPVMVGERMTLRELQASDAATLYAELTTPEVKRFCWPPPPNVIAFERYIDWTHAVRSAGKYVCYGVVPRDREDAWGIFELRSIQPNFFRAELDFAIAAPYWGSGVFYEAARMVIDFAFNTMKVHRLEARVPVDNERSNEALRKVGATREGTLKDAFVQNDRFVDQYLWALVANQWGRPVRDARDAADAGDAARTGTLG